MGSVGRYFGNIRHAVASIFEGMAVTLSWLVRRPHTVQYPDRIGKPVAETIAPRFRGLLESATEICTGCQLCMRTCPIGVILVEVKKGGDGNRYLTRFDIDASLCMYCGLCTEVCPTGAIRHTREFEMACGDRRKLVLHYVTEPVPPYKPSQKLDPSAVRPVGSIVRKLIERRDAAYEPYVPQEPPAGGGMPKAE
jgi:NADH-quinone oxidoreductase subunit I/NAD(P)H-quinone oxidoreductase subunit I